MSKGLKETSLSTTARFPGLFSGATGMISASSCTNSNGSNGFFLSTTARFPGLFYSAIGMSCTSSSSWRRLSSWSCLSCASCWTWTSCWCIKKSTSSSPTGMSTNPKLVWACVFWYRVDSGLTYTGTPPVSRSCWSCSSYFTWISCWVMRKSTSSRPTGISTNPKFVWAWVLA